MSDHSHSHSIHSHGDHSAADSQAAKSEKQKEADHFNSIMNCFYYYEQFALSANNRRLKDFLTLPAADRALLSHPTINFEKKLDDVNEAIRVNADFLRTVVDGADFGMFGGGLEDNYDDEHDHENCGGHSHDLSVSVEDIDLGPLSDDDADEDWDFDYSNPNPPCASHSHSYDDSDHSHSHSHELASAPPVLVETTPEPKKLPKPTDFDMDKMKSTLKQFVRDWSREGASERESSYKPLLDALNADNAHLSVDEKRKTKVLIPGAGLARLPWDVANAGYASQGNEFSYFMLLGSFCILNQTQQADEYTIHPYVHSFSNHQTTHHSLLRSVQFPDVNPASLPPGSDFSLIAGDFLDVYSGAEEAEQWDALLSCFFIDTARNIISYLRTIHNVLKKGGKWYNLGPLLWHFENTTGSTGGKDRSVELSLDEVKELAKLVGFEISQERNIPAQYTANQGGMLKYEYNAAFFVATKL